MTSGPHIIGGRLRNSTNVVFFTVDDPHLETGVWVEVFTATGLAPAMVVIAPGQVALYEPGEYPPAIIRVLTHDEVETMAARPGTGIAGTDRADTGSDPTFLRSPGSRLIGGIGPSHQPGTSVSSEGELYRQAKSELPRLGQVVRTGDGDGYVVGLDVFRKLATIRYDEPKGDVTIPASDVSCGNG